ncbi:MAG TPA: hypothetical protein VGO34_11050 [Alphaproteobacteria bacterium]|jgi:uncharacterized membrane protein
MPAATRKRRSFGLPAVLLPTLVLSIVALPALFLPGLAYALDPPNAEPGWGGMEPPPGWRASGWDSVQGHIMLFWPVLLLLALAGLWSMGIAIYRSLHPHALAKHPSPTASAHQIVAERFARGEIDQHEYAEKRRILGKH